MAAPTETSKVASAAGTVDAATACSTPTRTVEQSINAAATSCRVVTVVSAGDVISSKYQKVINAFAEARGHKALSVQPEQLENASSDLSSSEGDMYIFISSVAGSMPPTSHVRNYVLMGVDMDEVRMKQFETSTTTSLGAAAKSVVEPICVSSSDLPSIKTLMSTLFKVMEGSLGFKSRFPCSFQVTTLDASTTCVSKPAGFSQSIVVENRLVTSADYERPTHLVTFDFEGTDVEYQTGDTVVIMPQNELESVDRALEILRMDGKTPVQVRDLKGNVCKDYPSEATTLRNLLRYSVDIDGLCTRRALAVFSLLATDKAEADELYEMASSFEAGSPYAKAVSAGSFSFMDALKRFTSVRLDVAQLLSVLPAQKARYYSAASSSMKNGKRVQICFVVLNYPTQDGRLFSGTATTYLRALAPGDRAAIKFIRPYSPVVLDDGSQFVGVALGSGVALLRGITQHLHMSRAAAASDPTAAPGDMLMYYGVRHKSKDFCFQEELESYQRAGTLELRTAFSHDDPAKFDVCANRIDEDPKLIVDRLCREDGRVRFFYCGPSGPAYSSIESAVIRAMKTVKGEHYDAAAKISQLKAEKRWDAAAYTASTDPENPFK